MTSNGKLNIVAFLQTYWRDIVAQNPDSSIHETAFYVDPVSVLFNDANQASAGEAFSFKVLLPNDDLFARGKVKVVPFHRSTSKGNVGGYDKITSQMFSVVVGELLHNGHYTWHMLCVGDRTVNIPSHHYRCIVALGPVEFDYEISGGAESFEFEVGVEHFLQNT